MVCMNSVCLVYKSCNMTLKFSVFFSSSYSSYSMHTSYVQWLHWGCNSCLSALTRGVILRDDWGRGSLWCNLCVSWRPHQVNFPAVKNLWSYFFDVTLLLWFTTFVQNVSSNREKCGICGDCRNAFRYKYGIKSFAKSDFLRLS